LAERDIPQCEEDPIDKPPPPETFGGKDWSGYHNSVTVNNSLIKLPGFDKGREISDTMISNTESMESLGFLQRPHRNSLTPSNASNIGATSVDTLESI
jgi:hypothetical protein